MRGALPHALPENGGFLRVRFGEEMETNDRKKIRNDVILAVVLLLLAAAMLFWQLRGTEGDFAVVLIDGVETARYALDTDTEVEIITDGGGTNTLVIRDGEAFVETANCPDLVCAGHRAISRVGETIVCLPHKLVIKIAASTDAGGVDMAA